MKKIFLVMRREIVNTFHSRLYVFFAFILPVLVVLIVGAVKLIQSRSTSAIENENAVSSTYPQLNYEGIIDQSGFVQFIPEEFQNYLRLYSDEDHAKKDLQSGRISAYYIIPADYLDMGEIYYVYPNEKSFMIDGQSWVMSKTLMFNLLDADLTLLDMPWNPIRYLEKRTFSPQPLTNGFQGEDCSRPGASCVSNDLVRYMPSIMVALFFVTFMTSSNKLFDNVHTEKENRTIEVVLLSISPKQLLAGKILGLGLTGFLQTAVWLGSFFISFNLGGMALNLPHNFEFPIHILIWGLIYFVGGFSLYANLMAGSGALVQKMKEAGIVNYIILAPLFLGYIFGLIAPLSDTSNSPILIFLSIFPFTSPLVMIMRMTDGIVPLWQLISSVVLLFLTAYITLNTVASMFHAQNLLSGQPFSLKRYVRVMLGR